MRVELETQRPLGGSGPYNPSKQVFQPVGGDNIVLRVNAFGESVSVRYRGDLGSKVKWLKNIN